MGVRNCAEIGENLQKIAHYLLKNEKLVKLLYYSDIDPLGHENIPVSIKENEIFGKLIKIVPKVTTEETTRSIIVLKVTDGRGLAENDEFRRIGFEIEVFVPLDTWVIKDSNLRPFAILGAIQESLKDATVNELGKLKGGDFEEKFYTDKISCHFTTYSVVTYD